jgi:signal transduction histidine kinase
MKIRNRIPLIFTISAGLVVLATSLLVYFYSASFRNKEFIIHLQERVEITEQLFLEAQKMSPETAQEIREKFMRFLPEEKEEVGRVNQEDIEKLHANYPDKFVDRLLAENYAEFEQGDRQGVGKMYKSEGEDYWVIVTAIDQDGIRKMVNLRNILLIAGIIGVGLIFLISWLEARQFIKPISDKIEKAKSISASNLHLRLNVYNENDEIGEMTTTFNHMLDRLQNAFDTQRNFISNASHEIKNPLTAIIGEVDVALEKRRSGEEYETSLRTVMEEADRLNMLVTNLLSLAKTGWEDSQIIRSEFRLDELLMETIPELKIRQPASKIKIDFSEIPEDPDLLQIYGNANLLRVALVNLLENACKFSDFEEVKVKLYMEGEKICLTVSDQGVGIPSSELRNIKEPFYRAQNARSFKGVGIGVSLTDKIIRMHQGSLELASIEGEGTTASVHFQGLREA